MSYKVGKNKDKNYLFKTFVVRQFLKQRKFILLYIHFHSCFYFLNIITVIDNNHMIGNNIKVKVFLVRQ